MDQKMFCFQCEQTAGCAGCKGNAGVCGKKSDTANLQDKLTGALIGLARTIADGNAKPTDSTYRTIIDGLFTTVTNVNFDNAAIQRQIELVHTEKTMLVQMSGGCSSSGGQSDDYNMNELWNANEDIRSLKSLILFGLRGMSAYASHARVLGYCDGEVDRFFCEGLFMIGGNFSMEQLLPIVLKVGEINLKCMALLDKANTETYGTPVPLKVPLKVEKGPFIVVTGHDLRDLKLLLEQTKDSGINIYTHGEMLPAHAYPELKKYPQLKGNFGTAWQNQQKEFPNFPGPILFTTNCIQKPLDSYKDRVFTNGLVGWPGVKHITDKDYSAVVKMALAMDGFTDEVDGGQVLVGFGRNAVLGVADKVIEAVKAKAIRHFFLVGGCDGAKPGRNYYTKFVEQVPKDCVVLTLACGKFRFFDMQLGDIGGIPRLLDVGQCNDAYSAIQIAVALAKAFDCGVNDLPLSMILSWYEQKAVAILLTLLYLGIKDIRLGPSLPAFVSPAVLQFLVDTFAIKPVSETPEEDLKAILG